jgi:hypothetical protein
MLKLVPFKQVWITHDKLDLHAIYRRPRWQEDAYGEMVREVSPDGLPLWDLTGPLPVKSHNKHLAKGFEYVTLADKASLMAAVQTGTIDGHEAREYVQDPRTGGPWHYRKYIEGQAQAETDAAQKLREMVLKYGPDMVEEMKRETDPLYRLPDTLRNVASEPVAVQAIKRGKAVSA